jgi:hypothetical protein
MQNPVEPDGVELTGPDRRALADSASPASGFSLNELQTYGLVISPVWDVSEQMYLVIGPTFHVTTNSDFNRMGLATLNRFGEVAMTFSWIFRN